MTLLLPSLQAERIRRSVVDYLSTTFALTDTEARRALADFLEDEEQGVFVGPYVRLRMPYLPASARSDALDWDPGLTPYRHQEDAYRRLTTKDGHRPEPTIITTGTGSGKTEAFLHPVLDHVLRARAAGVTGVKALILYPMNALAADQADRLARLLASDPALASVRAAVYTGDSSTVPAKRVSADSLIEDRHIIRADPPDILLTNYKMLDQLLLRPEDRELWRTSAASLTYLVLDEFHTYDGAQGTDVAMLLRRLGLTLRSHLPTDDPRHADFTTSPLGPVCPVATSATLGDGKDPARMLAFARDVFGTTLTGQAVVTETRADPEQWAAAHRAAAAHLHLTNRARRLRFLSPQHLADLARIARALPDRSHHTSAHAGAPDPADDPASDSTELVRAVVSALYDLPEPADSPDSPDSTDSPGPAEPAEATERSAALSAPELAAALQSHPDVLELLSATEQATALTVLADTIVGPATDPTLARQALAAVLAALSVLRAGPENGPDRGAVSVEVTLWIREVTRVDRTLSANPAFTWADAVTERTDAPARPALYCRSCGRSGWGVVLAPTGQGEKNDQSQVRRDRLLGDPRFRALLHAPGEEAEYRRGLAAGEPDLPSRFPSLRWYSVDTREILTHLPQDADLETKEGRVLPVLTLTGDDKTVAEDTTHDVCPSCGAKDSIRFLGSAVATLLSVTLTTLFGDAALDDAEKRALIFTDSVQDAAHRAGFVDQRSHTMSLRSALRSALTAAMPIDEWADAVLEASRADAFDRYRLVPSALSGHKRFQPYWQLASDSRKRRRAETHVRRRLLFDIALEVGLQTTYGRTLEATGSLTVHVDAGRASALRGIARQVLGSQHQGVLPGFEGVTDAALLAWARGLLERMRRDGAIDHEWLERYKKDDGKRLWIWYKRRRDQGQPAFPTGRTAPTFPQVGGRIDTRRSAFVPVDSPRSWYATWTRACLPVSPTHAARLAGLLLARLAEAGVLSSTTTATGGTVYGLPAERVVVSPLREGTSDELLLVCSTCRTQLPGAADTVDQLNGAPCLTAACPGRLEARAHQAESFYRSMYAGTHVRRVDAHEHTSLLSAVERTAIEAGFKRSRQNPGDPNVLVATPTLEMGIDIGDLSTVMLASLPGTVASYVQRVGRAGRRSGSALALAYVPGRKNQLPALQDPGRLLNGSVAPPSTYLGAEEILRRQFLASVIDVLARENHPAVPSGGRRHGNARTALGSSEGSLISTVSERITRDGELLVSAFTSTFLDPTPALERLSAWVREDDGAGPREMLHRAAAEFRAEITELRGQERRIDRTLPELIAATERPNATEEDRRALRAAQGARRAVIKRITDTNQEHWVAALERHGILPNYALIDDTVRLSARVSWRDPDSDELRSEPYDIDRASARALSELAPGATFYTHGLEMGIEGIDSAGLTAQAQWWFCCACCGYVEVREPQDTRPAAPAQCPRCRDTAIADVGRARRVLHLTRVFADLSKEDARIGDSTDERLTTRFEVLPLADFDPDRVERQWSVEATGLGLARYRALSLRWLNTGRASAGQTVDTVADLPVTSRDFRLCDACGKLDTRTGASTPREHRPWCEHRSDPAEHVVTVDLMRALSTEALAVVLPSGFATDRIGVASLAAALLLGLEIMAGGTPDHLDIVPVPHPVADGDPGQTRPALLLHDLVPGGTGYLTDLDNPATVWGLLVHAGQRLAACPCRAEGKALCHRCLQPHAVSADVTRAAALHAIRQVLGLGKEDSLADLSPDTPMWSVTDRAVQASTGESPLEVRLRSELTARLGKEMAVRTIADPSGAPALEIDGGRWRIRPQLDLVGCRPDFTCLRPGGDGGIAVFADGRHYHATRTINRLADDAAKRARLRAAGYRVVSLTAADLDGRWEPTWLSDAAVTMVKNGTVNAARAASVTDQAVETWRGGPPALLHEMLLDDASGTGPQASAVSALADCVWAPLLIGASQGGAGYGSVPRYEPVAGDADPLWVAVRSLRPDVAPPGPAVAARPGPAVAARSGPADAGDPTSRTVAKKPASETDTGARSIGSVFSWPHLALAVRLTGTSTTAMALVLDDSDEALDSPDHAESWRTWLRLGNVLALAQAPVDITTASLALEELRDRAEAEASQAGVDREAMSSLGWDAVDRELTPEAVLALLPHLAAAGIAHADDGVEVADGVMTDLSWPDRRVAVVAESQEEDEAALTAAGWRVVVPGEDPGLTAANITALLEGH